MAKMARPFDVEAFEKACTVHKKREEAMVVDHVNKLDDLVHKHLDQLADERSIEYYVGLEGHSALLDTLEREMKGRYNEIGLHVGIFRLHLTRGSVTLTGTERTRRFYEEAQADILDKPENSWERD